MTWEERLRVLRWRSIEESDTSGELANRDALREATAHARGDLRSTSEAPLPARARDRFLSKRVAFLESGDVAAQDRVRDTLASMRLPALYWMWTALAWVGALALGFALTGLGEDREINLLALPLVGVLLWNAVVITLCLVAEVWPGNKETAHLGWLSTAVARFLSAQRMVGEAGQRSSDTGVAPRAMQRFKNAAWPLAWERLKTRFRAWLHIAAALLALGSGLGLYAKGWSREYRVIWESTLLNSSQPQSFFGALFAPASAAFGLKAPLEDLPAMRRTQGRVEQSGEALPWIHLYAGTLALLVIVPRVLLSILTLAHGARRGNRLWEGLGMERYAQRLLRSVEGGDESVTALLHGLRDDGGNRDRWSAAIQEKLGGLVRIDWVEIPAGEEDEFVESWQPRDHTVILLFNMATTPEEEVHVRLARELRQKLGNRRADASLLVMVDAANVRNRWSPEHLQSRRELWNKLGGRAVESLEFIDDVAEASNHLRAQAARAV